MGRGLEMTKKCEVCGKKLSNDTLTHCSDKCLFESIKNSKKFVPKKWTARLQEPWQAAKNQIIIFQTKKLNDCKWI